jgi:hypothetical protein
MLARRRNAPLRWCSAWKTNVRATEMAEPMGGATATDAVADFWRTGFHNAFAPGADKRRQQARGVDHLFHDWGV